MNETLADLYRQVGLQPAWQRQPEAQPGYTPPRPRPRSMRPAIARLYDPNQGVRDQAAAQVRRERELAANVPRALGGASGFPDRDQIAETGMNYMEMTGAPSLARGVQHVGRGEPGEAIPELLMGGLGALGMATLPYGGGAYAAATRQPMGITPRMAQVAPEPTPPIRPPARLPGRASDGSVLPMRPPEPFRNSMRGGSDDLMDAARAPDAGAWDAETFYHGSAGPIDQFDGPIHLTPDEKIAALYSNPEFRDVSGGGVIPLQIRRGRTLVVNEPLPAGSQRALIERARREGYDTIEMRAVRDDIDVDGNVAPQRQVIVLDARNNVRRANAPDGGASGAGSSSTLPNAGPRSDLAPQRGPAGEAIYRDGPMRMEIAPSGEVNFWFGSSTRTGGGTGAEAAQAFGAARRALADDMQRSGRSEYFFSPGDARQAEFYRSALPRAFPDFTFTEASNGRMRLTRPPPRPRPPPRRPQGTITSDPNGDPLQGLDTTPSVSDPVEMRMERARRMGFDTETPLYHGTHGERSGDFSAFDHTVNPPPSNWGMYGTGGTYLATAPEWANNFASVLSMEPRVMPLIGRPGRQFNVHGPRAEVEAQYRALYEAAGKDPQAALSWLNRGEPTQAYRTAVEDLGSFDTLGFDSVRGASELAGDEVLIFNPSNIRSRFAAFDPARSNSSDLLAGVTAGGVLSGSMWLDQQKPRPRRPQQ